MRGEKIAAGFKMSSTWGRVVERVVEDVHHWSPFWLHVLLQHARSGLPLQLLLQVRWWVHVLILTNFADKSFLLIVGWYFWKMNPGSRNVLVVQKWPSNTFAFLSQNIRSPFEFRKIEISFQLRESELYDSSTMAETNLSVCWIIINVHWNLVSRMSYSIATGQPQNVSLFKNCIFSIYTSTKRWLWRTYDNWSLTVSLL